MNKTRLGIAAAAFIAVLSAGAALAQDETDASSEALTPAVFLGSWEADCDAFGTPGRCETEWTQGLDASLYEQHYRVTARDSGALIFAGHGVYRVTEDGVDGYWSDSQGAIHALYGEWRDGALVIDWGAPSTSRGRSSYGVDPESDALHQIDWALTDDGWRQFMDFSYARAAETE